MTVMESQPAIGPLHASSAKLRRVKKRKTATQANFDRDLQSAELARHAQ